MFRLKLVPDDTDINFMGPWRYTFGASVVLVVLALVMLDLRELKL